MSSVSNSNIEKGAPYFSWKPPGVPILLFSSQHFFARNILKSEGSPTTFQPVILVYLFFPLCCGVGNHPWIKMEFWRPYSWPLSFKILSQSYWGDVKELTDVTRFLQVVFYNCCHTKRSFALIRLKFWRLSSIGCLRNIFRCVISFLT